MDIFSQTGGTRPRKSFFNLSHEVKFDCTFNQLIPVCLIECVPGDYMRVGVNAVCRFNPMVAPVLQEMHVSFFSFFVPIRIIDEDWEEIISGGESNTTTKTVPVFTSEEVASYSVKHSLWDYFGLPLGLTGSTGLTILKYPWAAYNQVWNEFFRDENLQTEDLGLVRDLYDNSVALRAWRKDYFTSALPFQQRGDAPSLPITGTSSAIFDSPLSKTIYPIAETSTTTVPANNLYSNGSSSIVVNSSSVSARRVSASVSFPVSSLNNNSVDFSSAGTFDANDFRIMFQTQKWQERNARAGVRYTELLRSHFGVAPSDARLQRPQYIGGATFPVMVSEVLQTSDSTDTSPQGNLAGHGLVAGRDSLGSIRV
jgi:hypothetical protein